MIKSADASFKNGVMLIHLTSHHDTYDIMKPTLQRAEIITSLLLDRILGLGLQRGVGRSGEMLWEGTQCRIAQASRPF